MKKITRDHTVPVAKRYQVREPVATVDMDEPFLVETINFRTPIIRSPEDAHPEHYREREESGPIFVNGIEPGDVLAIHIESIRPEGHASGMALPGKPGHGGEFMPIDEGRVTFPGGLMAPVQMMIGDIYVTPGGPVGGNPWDNGGNMDFRDVCADHVLLLRASLPGGLLVLGDLHAAQGDGEIGGVGAECAGEVQLRVTKDATYLPDVPTVVKNHSFVCIGCRRPYRAALDLAVDQATQVLARLTGCAEEHARIYVATVGSARNGAIWALGHDDPDWIRTLPVVVGIEVPFPEERVEQAVGGD